MLPSGDAQSPAFRLLASVAVKREPGADNQPPTCASSATSSSFERLRVNSGGSSSSLTVSSSTAAVGEEGGGGEPEAMEQTEESKGAVARLLGYRIPKLNRPTTAVVGTGNSDSEAAPSSSSTDALPAIGVPSSPSSAPSLTVPPIVLRIKKNTLMSRQNSANGGKKKRLAMKKALAIRKKKQVHRPALLTSASATSNNGRPEQQKRPSRFAVFQSLAEVDMREAKVCEDRRLFRFPDNLFPDNKTLLLGDAHLKRLVPEVSVGFRFLCKQEALHAGVHRSQQAGIASCMDKQGRMICESICISGAYADNMDLGETVVFTGQGGNEYGMVKIGGIDPVTGAERQKRRQVGFKDQTLMNPNNRSLKNAMKQRTPVRVLRGFKSATEFAPDWGYRYDGLYRVEGCEKVTGENGFMVFQFTLKRIYHDQPDPPWWDEEGEQ